MVSIIIPVHNVEKYICRCLNSIINQTYKNIEIILIENNSTDQSFNICKEYEKKDNRIRIYKTYKEGVSAARNIGLDFAQGEYITFCDSDDYYEKEYIYEMLNCIEAEDVDIVTCEYRYIYDNSKIMQPYKERYRGVITKEEFCEKIYLNNQIGGFIWNKIFKADIIRNIRFREELKICEDTKFLMDILNNNNLKLYYLNVCLYNYAIHQESAVNNLKNLINNKNQSEYTSTYKLIIKENNFNKEIYDYICASIVILAIRVKCDYISSQGQNREFIKNLNDDIKKYIFIFLKCRKLSIRQKGKACLNWIFNFKRIKKIIINVRKRNYKKLN